LYLDAEVLVVASKILFGTRPLRCSAAAAQVGAASASGRNVKEKQVTHTTIDGSYTKETRAHTHRKLIRIWLREPKGGSLESI